MTSQRMVWESVLVRHQPLCLREVERRRGKKYQWCRRARQANSLNGLWRGVSQEESVVVRIGSHHDIPGRRRANETAILGTLATESFILPVLDRCERSNWILMPYVEDHDGGTLRQVDLLQIFERLQRCSDVPEMDYPGLIRQWRALMPDGFPGKWLDDLAECLSGFSERDYCLTHHDLHPGNVLSGRNRKPVIIDWEYAGLGIGWLDIAEAAQYWGLEVGHIASLPLAAGCSLSDIESKLARAAEVNNLLGRIWSTWVNRLHNAGLH